MKSSSRRFEKHLRRLWQSSGQKPSDLAKGQVIRSSALERLHHRTAVARSRVLGGEGGGLSCELQCCSRWLLGV